jgi:Zn-dependent protease with chaperone function
MSVNPRITGVFYDGKTSGRQTCTLIVNDQGYATLSDIQMSPVLFSSLSISVRVGNTARIISLPNGGSFESKYNDEIDQLLSRYTKNKLALLTHHWESKTRYILISTICIVGLTVLAVFLGIPKLSEKIAYSLSSEFSVQLADNTLNELDQVYFKPSTLPVARRKELDDLFNQYLPVIDEFDFKLHFRNGGDIGANAFALPDGSVIITDQLIELAESNDEILSVLLHEIGHVIHRHALRRVIESTSTSFLFVWLTGDVEMATDWLAVLPALLIQSKYSRIHEREADTYALAQMESHKIDPIHFSTFMQKLAEYQTQESKTPCVNNNTSDQTCESEDSAKPQNENEATTEATTKEDKEGIAALLLKFIASHPPTQERIDRFRTASETIPASD